MEIEGHPTQDLIEELERRGGLRIAGTIAGPHADALGLLGERGGVQKGFWMFLPQRTFLTGVDEIPE